jgi:hypothetical protein
MAVIPSGAEGSRRVPLALVPGYARRRRAGVGTGLKPEARGSACGEISLRGLDRPRGLAASRLPLNRVAGNACRRKFRVVSTQRTQRSQRKMEIG